LNHLQYINTDSIVACQEECSDEEDCAAVSLDTDRGRCYLKAACIRDRDRKYVSAIRRSGMASPTWLYDWGCEDREYKACVPVQLPDPI
jgi:hypothetical protein